MFSVDYKVPRHRVCPSGFLGLIDGPVVDYLGYAALHHAPPDSKVSVGPEEFLEWV